MRKVGIFYDANLSGTADIRLKRELGAFFIP
jgi:hypothetical protein